MRRALQLAVRRMNLGSGYGSDGLERHSVRCVLVESEKNDGLVSGSGIWSHGALQV